MSKRVKATLSLDSEIYKEFQKFCRENDIMLSKRIERLIIKHLKEQKEVGNQKK